MRQIELNADIIAMELSNSPSKIVPEDSLECKATDTDRSEQDLKCLFLKYQKDADVNSLMNLFYIDLEND